MDEPDGRIAVVVGPLAQARAGDALLALERGFAPGHLAGCTCCRPRDGVAVALSRWYIAQVRGGGRLPRRLRIPSATAITAARIERVIDADALLRARFRFDGWS